MDKVSIVIPNHNEGENLRNTIESIIENTIYENYEIIVVDDNSEDDSCNFLYDLNNEKIRLIKANRIGMTKVKNMGAKNARGDKLVFADAHTFPKNKIWLDEIVNFLDINKKSLCGPCISNYYNTISRGYGGQITMPKLRMKWLGKINNYPYEVPMVCGCFMAMKKETFFDIGMFNKNFIGWGPDDSEICLRAWTMGFKVNLLPHIEISHIFRKKFPYKIDNNIIFYNILISLISNLSKEKIEKSISLIKKERNIENLLEKIEKNGIWEDREEILKRRKYDDDWFFKKFNIDF